MISKLLAILFTVNVFDNFISAFGWMFWAVWARYYGEYFVPGWASALSITTFLFGILFMLLGIIGDYIGRILIEVKGRPRYLVSESVGLDSDESTERSGTGI